MSFASRFLIPTCAAAGVLTFAVAQKGPEQLSARDMFYHPVQESPSSGGARKTPNTGKSGTKGAVQVAPATRDKAPDRPQSTQTQVPNPAVQTPADGGRVIPATVRKTAAPPADNPALGLRYTLV